ncbi:hypothetical protein PENTCL1PPCAC_3689 [Pristionchus entomophagus]|uniref:Uncharacterized protein n=1 Tax=Pristionchus entomophagus TaxID=358040 RepID=A0AAV5SF94_9BILA|nr:hypothetical protein PENTCL1PPCAC_3689 [Pristionchus entomophagus]
MAISILPLSSPHFNLVRPLRSADRVLFPLLDTSRRLQSYPEMRLLPILLIAFALLPLSAALECYSLNVNHKPGKWYYPGKDKETCRDGENFCVTLYPNNELHHDKKKACVGERLCKKVGCERRNDLAFFARICCCNTDLCNIF